MAAVDFLDESPRAAGFGEIGVELSDFEQAVAGGKDVAAGLSFFKDAEAGNAVDEVGDGIVGDETEGAAAELAGAGWVAEAPLADAESEQSALAQVFVGDAAVWARLSPDAETDEVEGQPMMNRS